MPFNFAMHKRTKNVCREQRWMERNVEKEIMTYHNIFIILCRWFNRAAAVLRGNRGRKWENGKENIN